MALVQAVGAVLLIANMVQVAAYTRRTEIGIMRLVGASRWYTQLPFLLEAVLAATIGVVLAIVGLIVVRALFLEKALSQFYQANLIAKIDYADILYYRADRCSWWAWRWRVSRRTSRCACTCEGSCGQEDGRRKEGGQRATTQDRRDQSQSAAQLFDPRHLRGRGGRCRAPR